MKEPTYLPFIGGQWRLAMGLKPLDLGSWIEINAKFNHELQIKSQLLTQRYADVFASLPGSEAGQREVFNLLMAHLLHHFPQHYQWSGDRLVNCVTGQIWYLADFEKNLLDLAGRLVQEDLCLMLPKNDDYVLSAASVCFPSRWQLSEKLGKPIAQIHQDVPGYSDKLQRPVNAFFERLQVDRPGYRLNWSIVDTPVLYLEQNKGQEKLSADITPENAGERLWLRVERQTLRRLKRSGGILFTIRTYVHPLHLLASEPEVIRDLAAAIEQIPSAMQVYKNLVPIRAALLSYLKQAQKNFEK